MENLVEIIVVGSVKSGKTNVAQEIVDNLRNLGFNVRWETKPKHSNEKDVRKEGLERLQQLEAITDKTNIVVKEKTIKRDFNALLNYRVGDYTDNN